MEMASKTKYPVSLIKEGIVADKVERGSLTFLLFFKWNPFYYNPPF